MKVCAVTMVYRDYWALSQWYRHYGKQLGEQNLFIIAHGDDPKVQRICPQASVITIAREKLDGFDWVRGQFLNKFQASLLELYDWVIRTDADELICLDPEQHTSFSTFFANQASTAVFALGLDLAERADDTPLKESANVFDYRDLALFSGHYSKAFAVRKPENLVRHGVQVRPRQARWFQFNMPEGAYLVHLKYANRHALAEANKHRSETANRPGKGLPGMAWRKADEYAKQFFDRIESLPSSSWEEARDEAIGRLRDDAKRDTKIGLVRARQLKFKKCTSLPSWFQSL